MNNYFTLNHRIVFYTPSTQGTAKPITRAEHLIRTRFIADTMSQLFGGATIERAQGYYKSNDGKIVTENIDKVISYTDDKSLEELTEKFLNLALNSKILWAQESIAVEIDSRMMFIE